jgi:hypothetical protein
VDLKQEAERAKHAEIWSLSLVMASSFLIRYCLNSSRMNLDSYEFSFMIPDFEVFVEQYNELLKIQISSNGLNCSILSQKVPKFELYKHNDELLVQSS